MQIAQRLAGYTLGGADLLRRAMGKKKADEMAQQRAVFTEGAKKNGIDASTATAIFDLMEKFANYGFNKSHAAAYALVSYQTAWLKAHHPSEFMAAVLSCDMDHTDTVVMMLEECRRMGLKVHAPDINSSDYRFTVNARGEIVYGLGAIKGMGAAALEGILAERAKGGRYTDLENFCRRIDTRKANKRVLEAMIFSGALDSLGRNRPTLLKNLPTVLQKCEADAADADAGQVDLFGAAAAGPAASMIPYVEEPEWPDVERLTLEKNTLGYYLSGHPIESHRQLIEQICPANLKTLIEQQGATPTGSAHSTEGGEQRYGRKGTQVLVGAWLTEVRRFGRRGTLTLDDRTAQVSVALNEEFIDKLRQLPKADQLLFVSGRLSPDNFTGGWQIRPQEIFDLEEAQRRCADRILLKWPKDRDLNIQALEDCLKPLCVADGCPVTMTYVNGVSQSRLDFGPKWRVRAQEAALAPLRRLLGEGNVRILYRKPVVSTPEPAYAGAYSGE